MKFRIALAAGLASLLAGFTQPAMAVTVAAYSWLPSQTALPASAPDCTTESCNLLDYQSGSGGTNSPLPTIPVNFLEDFLTLTTVSVSNTQISITNNASNGLAFCPSSGACGYDGFEFLFSSGFNMVGASVDPTSASDFLPNSTGPHLGLDLVSPTELWIDVSNDAPNTNDSLVIDLTSGNVSATPLPAALPLFASGLGVIGLFGWRRKKKAAALVA